MDTGARPVRGRDVPLQEMARDGRVLAESYRLLADAIRDEEAITPSAEWFVDNYHIVADQLREIREDLPRSFYRQLPKIAAGAMQGLPRIYRLVQEYLNHTDSHFEPDSFAAYLRAYQRIQPLTIGELWATAITLRIVLVDSLRQCAERMLLARRGRRAADAIADQILAPGNDKEAPLAPLDISSATAVNMYYCAQLFQRLRGQGPAAAGVLTWLATVLEQHGLTGEELVALVQQRQASMNVSVRNIITSMRLLSTYDWKEMVEGEGKVDEILRASGSFQQMDFATRDQYRHAVEELARWSQLDEPATARKALSLAEDEWHPRRRDPGFFLISEGRTSLESALQARVPLTRRAVRAFVSLAGFGYMGTLNLVCLLLLLPPVLITAQSLDAWLWLLPLALLAWFPASDLAVDLVNRYAVTIVKPRLLPKLDFRTGIPAESRTMVVIPTLLADEDEIREQVAQLEIHFLANQDEQLFFALLTDWLDAPAESMPRDDELLETAITAIRELNKRHGPAEDGGARFYLYHRRRVYNLSDSRWMGWERKRGKLHEFNRLLRGDAQTSFLTRPGLSLKTPTGVRYVITLDSDTRLPLDAARRLVGAMAHPLNRPQFEAAEARVVAGYGILQPRVSLSLPTNHEASIYQRVYAGARGIDPYASAVSDVYQDLYGEGSFTGKGIYDVDAFEAALDGKVPENRLLSHDLFEGLFARAGLVTDIELFEEYPANYLTSSARQHRWTRGDFQLLPWIIRGSAGQQPERKAALARIGRWKMLDNLRRALSAPASFLTLISAWYLPPETRLYWIGLVIATFAVPAMLPVLLGILPRRRGISKRAHFLAVLGDFNSGVARVALTICLMPHQAFLFTDAIVRALFRLTVSKRNLLEWIAAAQTGSGGTSNILTFIWRMRGGSCLVLVAAVAAVTADSLSLAAPFLVLWALSPVVAWEISLPRRRAETPATPAQRKTLRLIALRTWRFFETFVTAEDNWLPPDNYQEDPAPVTAHRTSPSNIGLYIMSTLAARDFGWLGSYDMVEQLEKTFVSLKAMEKYAGHLYNWYDTQDLLPLAPLYVSSVDSGNLAGNLIVLQQACRDLLQRPVIDLAAAEGIDDAFALLRTAVQFEWQGAARARLDSGSLGEQLDQLAAALLIAGRNTASFARQLPELKRLSQSLPSEDIDASGHSGEEILTCSQGLRRKVESHLRDAETLLSWVNASDDAEPASASLVQVLMAEPPSLVEAPARFRQSARQFESLAANEDSEQVQQIEQITTELEKAAVACEALIARVEALALDARAMFDGMDFSFLFDETRHLLSIGYNVSEGARDESFYDLLASEARLASYVAIAKGDVPWTHWFQLGRPLTPVDIGAALVSWSGSMFEYLMPALVMQSPSESLLGQTYRLVVRRQRTYAASRTVPWGISEAGYSGRDLEMTYQYAGFGVPGLGLARGLSQELVVTPYATALAAMVDASAALNNFSKLSAVGLDGRYGFYEAADFTRRRSLQGGRPVIVRSYMAHHQGMTIVAIANVVLNNPMQRRFHAEPIIQASDLLLQERTPRDVGVARLRTEEVSAAGRMRELLPLQEDRFSSPHEAIPRTHLLSNGRYALMLTAAGTGYSRWRDLAVNRWREDATLDPWGSFIYLRDADSGRVWSATYQPTGAKPDFYDVHFQEHTVQYERRDESLATRLEVVVSFENDAELRRLTLTNHSSETRNIEVTSYFEVVLTTAEADLAHEAFSNLFVETEFTQGALLATRRGREASTAQIVLGQVMAAPRVASSTQYETDRRRFLGRDHTAAWPAAVMSGEPLSNSTGAVLDPVFSQRCQLSLAPGEVVHVTLATFVTENREEALRLADNYQNPSAFERAQTMAWTQARARLSYLNITTEEASLFQQLANLLIFAQARFRAQPNPLHMLSTGVPALWALGISGDLPILILRVESADQVDAVRQLLRAQDYWRMKGLAVDIVVLNDRAPTYGDELNVALENLLNRNHESSDGLQTESRGSIRLLNSHLIKEDELNTLLAAARVVLLSRLGTLSDQLRRLSPEDVEIGRPDLPAPGLGPIQPSIPLPRLEFFNETGGFAEGGREYITIIRGGETTPAPWVNVVANPDFGFIASATGGGYTWSVNSRENKLTSWSNDRVSDQPSEVVYLQDQDTGALWSATAEPIRLQASYVARHGLGYSAFEHISHDLDSQLLQFVPLADSVKISRLSLRNLSTRPRRIRVTAYAEWVLGVSRAQVGQQLLTEIDPETGAVFAINPWNQEVGQRVAFAAFSVREGTASADRLAFIGRNGSLAAPAALQTLRPLNGRTGGDLDPCAALQCSLEIDPSGQAEVAVLLGQAATREEARELIERYRSANLQEVLDAVKEHWQDVTTTLQVRTPDRSFDILLNSWLLYQTLSCRLWARAGFYQVSGAYGYRDQLQDVLALLLTRPALAREHLLRAAMRQFPEGDVQHWWHLPSGKGVRTRISDDLLWLPYAVWQYIEVTGDSSILDEQAPFLAGPLLLPEQAELYFQPEVTQESVTIFEHCARAIDHSLHTGENGLPLMGSSDWNDGMNRVGAGGKGESVWLGWFLASVLKGFEPLAAARQETRRARAWSRHRQAMAKALEQAWDGAWYRRGYFDDGSPLGSSNSEECRIDSIAQSWALLSGTGNPKRAVQALESAQRYLIDANNDLASLFAPPFDKGQPYPGYVADYPPGVRENGGQYSHAAAWLLMAFAGAGDGEAVGQLLSALNPIRRSSSARRSGRYEVEPYVVAGDVYAADAYAGRGGWTWYTGSAAWMYRACVEYVLGFRLRNGVLYLDPCLPMGWRDFEIVYRFGSTRYLVKVVNATGVSHGVTRLEIDGKLLAVGGVPLVDDGKEHSILAVVG